MAALALALLYTTTQWGAVQGQHASAPSYSVMFGYGATPAPTYMVDNTDNFYHVAPDKGNQNGPVWQYSGSLENYIANLANNKVIRGAIAGIKGTITTPVDITASLLDPGLGLTGGKRKQETSSDYWLTTLAPLGSQPLAGSGYQFYRDVTAFGADPTGSSDSAESINAAASSWNQGSAGGSQTRCGETCGDTFTRGAIVYFPPGTYKICTPVIQYYYTQFIGDANNPPTIKGCDTFQGIALFDTDPYIPGGSGSEWYINQNQFFRQIRNFIFDLTDMPNSTKDNDQPLVPTGIHWQVAQATSLQNLVFNMPVSIGSSSQGATTAVGIFMENGSGGFVSDLTFNGGNIGWRAGSQQYTARNLVFNNCLTSIQMVWDWGFNWQGITINGGSIGLNISGIGGVDDQGIGSVSLIDSSINSVSVGILTNNLGTSPNIVLDNTVFRNVATAIQVQNGNAILSGSPQLWATGARYNGGTGSYQTGAVTAPAKDPSLLTTAGAIYTRSRPQYETASLGAFSVATRDGGCKNDGTGDQTGCLNAFLQKALAASQIAYFPAGIYRVGGTVLIPTGSVVQGSSWSQIQGAGFYFSDMNNPRVMVQVGNPGEKGKMEIVEMLFSVQGNTAGAVLMEWNTAADTQGEACMWDSHFRVGGALGSDLELSNCPKSSDNPQCIAASLMFRVTAQASGYFENIWAWVADHDNDASLYNVPDSSSTQLEVFGARGMLIESQGPSWFVGTSSEHSVLYNYQLSGANAIYMGHIQTESPYYQPLPAAPAPFGAAAASFPNDPDFSQCPIVSNEKYNLCNYAWGLRVVDSSNVYIQSAGLYSFFNDFYQDCVGTNNCQERILEVAGSTGVVVFNLFTVGIVEPANGISNTFLSQATLQRGFTTETSVWVPLPGFGLDIVYVGPGIFSTPTVSCPSTCLLVFPTSSLSAPSTISIGSYTTSFEYGSLTTTTTNNAPAVIFVTSTTTVTISVPSITISGLPFSNVNITSSGPTPITIYPSVDVSPATVELPNGSGGTTSRVITLPPWPLISAGPSGSNVMTDPETVSPGTLGGSTTYFTPIDSTITANSAGVTTVTFPATASPSSISCPATTAFTFATPSITVITTCTASTISSYEFSCPTTKIVTLLGPTTGVVSVDCSLVTSWSSGADQSSSSTTTPLPVYATYPRFGSITPVTTTVPAPVVTGGGVNVPCKAWFFFVCISTRRIHIGGFLWILPPGIYPPGPPPLSIIQLPPGFTIEGNLPPWPQITIGNDGQITTESEPECQTQSASICSFTTSYKVSGTKTTSTSVSSTCETITGCSVRGEDYSTTAIATDGTQTLAPVGTEYDEDWATATTDAAFSSSVFAAFSASVSLARATGSGSVVSFTTGPTPAPTCASGTGCGGKLCSGYYCSPTLTGYPPGYQAPNDPNSGGFSAPATTITPETSSTSHTLRHTTITPPASFIEGLQHNIYEDNRGGFEDAWFWEVINRPNNGETYNVCSQTEIFNSRQSAGSDSNFATQLGTFSVANHGACTYTGPTTGAGYMTCQDRYSATCTAYANSVRTSALSCAGGGGALMDNRFPEFYCNYS